MKLSRTILLIFLSTLLSKLIMADTNFTLTTSACSSNYTLATNEGSTYQNNLKLALSDLASKSSSTTFYNTTYGERPNRVHALYLCRGDVNPQVCHGCIRNATSSLLQDWPSYKEGLLYAEKCMLRYANHSLGDEYLTATKQDGFNVTNYRQFNLTLTTTVEGLINEAAFSNPSKAFATREANITESEKLHTLAQCIPNIKGSNCSMCLKRAFSDLQECCDGKQGAMVFLPSCQMRYANKTFYETTGSRFTSPVPGKS